MPLTALQERALARIRDSISETGAAPTRNELAATLDTSRKHVDRLLDALARRRRIRIEPGAARGISVESAGGAG
jgi:SOS-response transcriptional repressor LexA